MSRSDFNESWLVEMPEGLGKLDLFDMIQYNIRERIKAGSSVEHIGNISKITGSQTAFYWIEQNGHIAIGVELSVKPQALVVNAIAKNPMYRGRPPYASELYAAILKDQPKSIRPMSDTQLSDEGFKIWQKLLSAGHKVSVYDNKNPGQTFKTFNSLKELNDYFQDDDSEFRRYQFVISESTMFGETQSFFLTRRLRELGGLSVE